MTLVFIDMIYNLPNQTNEIWEDDLETAISCGSKHLTIYPLVLLEKARLYSQYVKINKCPISDQEKEIRLLEKSGYIEVDDNRIKFTNKGNIWSNNVRTFFENDVLECTDKYYASITRIKASGDWTWANRAPETKCQ